MARTGRPSKYRKEFCNALLEHFNVPVTTLKRVTKITKAGIVEVDVEQANPLPTLESFSRKIGIAPKNLLVWVERYPEFRNAYDQAKAMQKDILNQNALMGRYSEGYAKFVAINCTDMVDKSSRELSGKDGAPIEQAVTVKVDWNDGN